MTSTTQPSAKETTHLQKPTLLSYLIFSAGTKVRSTVRCFHKRDSAAAASTASKSAQQHRRGELHGEVVGVKELHRRQG